MNSHPISEKLREACIGHPNARIPWPHRLLHDAADTIDAQAVEIERLRELCITEAAKWAARELHQMERAEVAERERDKLRAGTEELAVHLDKTVNTAADAVNRANAAEAQLTRYKAVVAVVLGCLGMGDIEQSERLDALEATLAALEDG